jgi:hypothetical protein
MVNLSMLFKEIMIVSISINIAVYLIGTYHIFPQLSLGFVDLTTISGWFSTNPFDYLFVLGGAGLVGVTALLTRSGTYAIYATVITIVGLILTPIRNCVTIIPTLLSQMLTSDTNPVIGVHPIVAVINLIIAFASFWFLVSLILQKDI